MAISKFLFLKKKPPWSSQDCKANFRHNPRRIDSINSSFNISISECKGRAPVIFVFLFCVFSLFPCVVCLETYNGVWKWAFKRYDNSRIQFWFCPFLMWPNQGHFCRWNNHSSSYSPFFSPAHVRADSRSRQQAPVVLNINKTAHISAARNLNPLEYMDLQQRSEGTDHSVKNVPAAHQIYVLTSGVLKFYSQLKKQVPKPRACRPLQDI